MRAIRDSPHVDTALGALAMVLGILIGVAVVVGLAVILAAIAEGVGV